MDSLHYSGKNCYSRICGAIGFPGYILFFYFYTVCIWRLAFGCLPYGCLCYSSCIVKRGELGSLVFVVLFERGSPEKCFGRGFCVYDFVLEDNDQIEMGFVWICSEFCFFAKGRVSSFSLKCHCIERCVVRTSRQMVR